MEALIANLLSPNLLIPNRQWGIGCMCLWCRRLANIPMGELTFSDMAAADAVVDALGRRAWGFAAGEKEDRRSAAATGDNPDPHAVPDDQSA